MAVIPQGRAKLAAYLAALLGMDAGTSLTSRMRGLAAEVHERWQGLDRRIAELELSPITLYRLHSSLRRRCIFGIHAGSLGRRWIGSPPSVPGACGPPLA